MTTKSHPRVDAFDVAYYEAALLGQRVDIDVRVSEKQFYVYVRGEKSAGEAVPGTKNRKANRNALAAAVLLVSGSRIDVEEATVRAAGMPTRKSMAAINAVAGKSMFDTEVRCYQAAGFLVPERIAREVCCDTCQAGPMFPDRGCRNKCGGQALNMFESVLPPERWCVHWLPVLPF